MNQYSKSEQLALVGPILNRAMDPTPFPQIAVDGGARFAHQPIFWVGDGDSGKPDGISAIFKKTSQDETDLHFCLKQIQNWEWTKLHLFGFLGARRDHELANLGEVCHAVKSHTNGSAVFYDENYQARIYVFPAGLHSIALNTLFSVLAFENSTISISGDCQFKITEQSIDAFSGRGISNVGHGLIEIQSSAPFMVLLGEE